MTASFDKVCEGAASISRNSAVACDGVDIQREGWSHDCSFNNDCRYTRLICNTGSRGNVCALQVTRDTQTPHLHQVSRGDNPLFPSCRARFPKCKCWPVRTWCSSCSASSHSALTQSASSPPVFFLHVNVCVCDGEHVGSSLQNVRCRWPAV